MSQSHSVATFHKTGGESDHRCDYRRASSVRMPASPPVTHDGAQAMLKEDCAASPRCLCADYRLGVRHDDSCSYGRRGEGKHVGLSALKRSFHPTLGFDTQTDQDKSMVLDRAAVKALVDALPRCDRGECSRTAVCRIGIGVYCDPHSARFMGKRSLGTNTAAVPSTSPTPPRSELYSTG